MKDKKQKILVVGDIHQRYEQVQEAFDLFLIEDYDKIILLGDIFDSHDRTDEDAFRTIHSVLTMKRIYPDKVVILVGNHDEQYLAADPEYYKCSGFRQNIHSRLHALLAPEKRHFQYAYGVKNYLFTHAGVSLKWFMKHFHTLQKWADKMGMDICEHEQLWQIIEGVSQTHDKQILFEIGPERGGFDSNQGGPLWCDRKEIMREPYPHIHQVVGHSKVSNLFRIEHFEAKTRHPNTSVTFTDCLSVKTKFLTLKI